MGRCVEIVAAYRLPASLDLTPGCFGKRFRIDIGDLRATAIFPDLVWIDDEPRVSPPPMSEAVKVQLAPFTDGADNGWPSWHYWGRVTRYNPKRRRVLDVSVGAILLKLRVDRSKIVYDGDQQSRRYPEGPALEELFGGLDAWFESLRTWIEAALDQDADPGRPVSTVHVQAEGLHALILDGDQVSRPASSSQLTVAVTSSESVSLALLRKVFREVRGGRTPGDAHLLLRDSRAELRRGNLRRAVIDAGSATEISLADYNANVTRVATGTRPPTLGWYVAQPTIAAAAGIPAATMQDLVGVRNDAIHQNLVPTRGAATLALSIAAEIVGRIDPLPVLSA